VIYLDSHGILARWSNHFSQPLNVLGCTVVRKTEVHTAEPIVPEPIAFGFKMAIYKTKGHKSPGIDHIPTELFRAGGKTISSVP
jgi:hypothetical protein